MRRRMKKSRGVIFVAVVMFLGCTGCAEDVQLSAFAEGLARQLLAAFLL